VLGYWKAALMALITVLLASPAMAQRDREWVVIGEQSVGFGTDTDVIKISNRAPSFWRLRLGARGNDIFVNRMRVIFANGASQDIQVNELIREGKQSAILNLKGEARGVDRISITYRARPGFGGRATVIIYGEADLPPPPPSAGPIGGGWDVLASETVSGRDSTVTLRVGRREGRFTKIRFRAVGAPLLISGVQVVFGNGEKQNINLVERLMPGQEGRPIDIDGERRFIQEVIVYKRPSFQPGRGKIELLGLQGRGGFPPPGAGPIDPGFGRPEMGIPSGWVLFGAQSVGFATERDVITIDRDLGYFDRIALRAVDNDIFLREITLIYANGERDRLVANTELKANYRTPPLQLRGDRFIRKIELVYRARPGFGGRAVLEVYGNYSDAWIGERGRRRDYNQGWLLLGAQRAPMLSPDIDTFRVGERFGRFKALRLTSRNRDVRFYGMRIVYGNGETEDVPFFGELKGGQSTQPLDLKGRGRFIDRIELRYRSKLSFKGEGVVEVWGLI
jgi:hypothetical protein